MPTLTGSVADVTGVALAPGQIRQVFVKAPGERPSLADGGVLIVSAPVQLGSSGSLSVTLEPGPAVLTVDTYAGGPDVYDLYVTADMTLLSEAIDEAAPEHERSWSESVMIQLRDEAVAAAGRAEAAAGNVDDAIAGAADAVVQAVEADRVAAELAREGAESARDAAAGSESAAAGSEAAAAGSASSAANDRDQTGLDRAAAHDSAVAADVSRVAAASSAGAASSSASAAAGSASAADGARAGAEAAEGRARDHAESFGVTAEGVTGAPGSETTVQVSGDGPAYHLVVTTPRGDEGEQGPPGEVSQDALDAAVATLVDNAPEALNTLSELADALGGDPNFATTVSTEIGKRALVDGAPAAYNTLGKLVSALIAGDLGGSTDASVLTGALTGQVDASGAIVGYDFGDGYHPTMTLGELLSNQLIVTEQISTALDSKSDVGHTHTPSEVGAVARSGSAVTLWSGTAAQYAALAEATKNAAGFVAVIVD